MKIVESDGSERERVDPLLVLHTHEVVGGLAFTRYPALYAYTTVPEFYLKAGWSVLTAQDDHSVLVKEIGSS